MTKRSGGAYDWITKLQGSPDVAGVASLRVRRRTAELIGEAATNWAVETGSRMATYILQTLPDWPGTGSDEELQVLHRATEASTLDTLAALFSGEGKHLWGSFEPIENVGWYVRQQVGLAEVIRNVHTGQEFLIQELMRAIADLVPETDRVDTISRMTRDVTSCWSGFIGRIGDEYRRQQEDWMRTSEGQKARLVQAILQRGNVDAAEASQVLGYDLTQEHVCCLLWFEGLDLDAVRLLDFASIAREVAAAAGSTTHLSVNFSDYRLEVWLGSPTKSPAEVLRHGRWPTALHAAVGDRLPGVDGFRTSRAEAVSSSQVAARSGAAPAVIAYPDVELVSLLTCDFDRARAFVRRTLGPIARQDTRAQELRQTLAAWIDSAGSVTATSQALFMHRNTVNYRLRQLEDLLGQDWDRTRLRCALTIAEWMPQVLD